MNPWQLTMAIGLGVNAAAVLALWGRSLWKFRDMMWALSPPQRLFLRNGWLAAALPAAEAWVLWMGGFFR